MTEVKLCGMSRPEDIEAVNALEPRYVGFVFYPGSRRNVSPEAAKVLVDSLKPGITPVGVFLDAEPDFVEMCCSVSGVRAVQIHGAFGNSYVERIRSLTHLSVIQAFKVSSRDDLERASKSTADEILLDNGYGGTGESFDWSLLRHFRRRYFLAGGLTPANVKNAITCAHPYAVDVSSGIETENVKDPAKMSAFMDAVREADSQ